MKKFTKRLVSLLFTLTLVVCGTVTTCIVSDAKTSNSVTIGSVLIQGTDVAVVTSGTAASEDGLYHLVASDPNQSAPVGTDVVQAAATNGASFTVPLAKGTANSMLFKKFTVCVMNGGALTPVSNSMYITNPEGCASAAPGRMDFGKKGILPALEKNIADLNQPADLGVKQVNLNIPLSVIDNPGKLAGYDYSVRKYNAMGMQVNVIVLADINSGGYINPYAADGLGAHNYYGLNANTTEGVNSLANAASFLGRHYAGGANGQVDNFIIGNEVNAWWLWNYMNCGSNDVFMNEYANAFRIMYNGIKSENATANVYCCIDHQWARAEASYYISGKEFVTKFNNIIKSQGNVDWRLAVHPYNAPLYAPNAWATGGGVTHSQNTAYVTMANIDVLTDFMCSSDMLSSTGAVRSVKCSEVGYTSANGENLQAASLVYAYLVAENNRYIDGLVISREMDHIGDIAQGMVSGLCNTDASHKMGYDFYKNAADPNYIAQASAAAGVDLQSLITPR